MHCCILVSVYSLVASGTEEVFDLLKSKKMALPKVFLLSAFKGLMEKCARTSIW